MKNISTIQKLSDPAGDSMDKGMLTAFVKGFTERRDIFLDAFARFGSPLYLFDEDALCRRADEFQLIMEKHLPRVKCFYAMKTNSHPFLVSTLFKKGYGIDVSSGEELKIALECGAPEIIFSGPAKTEEELRLACQHAGRVTVLLDSFRELETLSRITAHPVAAGVRLTTEERGLWKKFGIPLRELPRFFKEAGRHPLIDLCGLQFHTSWNLDPEKQIAFLSRLGEVLRGMDAGALEQIRFVDIGGGYWPKEGEWLHPETGTDPGHQGLDLDLKGSLNHRCLPAMPLEDFAARLAAAFNKHISPYVDAGIYLEPGRWISHVSMHLLLQVLDKKDEDLVITDAGTNTVGWERFETDYFPVINMSRPSDEERPCLICGSLCTPHDIWGYAYFGEQIEPGDILVIPTQGAYTYSLRQNFIKALPKEIILRGSSLSLWGR